MTVAMEIGRRACTRQAARRCRWTAAITLAFLQAGGLAARATEREKPRYCDGERTTELRKAAASPTAVFLQLESRSPDRNAAGRRVMRIPLDDFRGPPGRPANREVTSLESESAVASSDTRVREVSGWLLPPGSPIPPDADPLPVVKMDDSARLSQRAAASKSIRILSLGRVLEHGGDADSGTISPKSLVLADPVIAITRRRGDGSTAVLILADVHQGCEHERGWYALTPLAVSGEAALAAPLAGHLLLSGLWLE
ncbi:MAG TPA: hypothetical protein VGR67_07615 [Candidatus Polarisedimenticolia bacterium]|jgi:hypothetical protein|nr:hypothetical protein [Candidatus Polarisedimenticolia bacterium]